MKYVKELRKKPGRYGFEFENEKAEIGRLILENESTYVGLSVKNSELVIGEVVLTDPVELELYVENSRVEFKKPLECKSLLVRGSEVYGVDIRQGWGINGEALYVDGDSFVRFAGAPPIFPKNTVQGRVEVEEIPERFGDRIAYDLRRISEDIARNTLHVILDVGYEGRGIMPNISQWLKENYHIFDKNKVKELVFKRLDEILEQTKKLNVLEEAKVELERPNVREQRREYLKVNGDIREKGIVARRLRDGLEMIVTDKNVEIDLAWSRRLTLYATNSIVKINPSSRITVDARLSNSILYLSNVSSVVVLSDRGEVYIKRDNVTVEAYNTRVKVDGNCWAVRDSKDSIFEIKGDLTKISNCENCVIKAKVTPYFAVSSKRLSIIGEPGITIDNLSDLFGINEQRYVLISKDVVERVSSLVGWAKEIVGRSLNGEEGYEIL